MDKHKFSNEMNMATGPTTYFVWNYKGDVHRIEAVQNIHLPIANIPHVPMHAWGRPLCIVYFLLSKFKKHQPEKIGLEFGVIATRRIMELATDMCQYVIILCKLREQVTCTCTLLCMAQKI